MKSIRALFAFAVLFFVLLPNANAQLVHPDTWQQYVDFKQTIEVRFLRGGGGATAFNNGRSQVGFDYLQGGGEYPTLNLAKLLQNWNYGDNTILPPDQLDTNGYPNNPTALAAHGGVVTAGLTLPSQAVRSGNYILMWDGGGTISGFDTAVSYNITGITNAGSCVLIIPGHNYLNGNQIPISAVGGITGLNGKTFTITSIVGNAVTINASTITDCSGTYTAATGSATFSLTSLAGSVNNQLIQTPSSVNAGMGIASIISSSEYPHNMAIIFEGDRAAYLADTTGFGGIGTQFKSRLTSINYGVLRFMNWQNDSTGGNNCSTWDNCNRPTNYYTWQGGQLRSDLLGNLAGSGLTNSTTGSDYTISAPSTWPAPVASKPADKATVHVVFATDTTQCDFPNFGCTLAVGASNNVTWAAHNKKVGNGLYFTYINGDPSGGTQPVISDFKWVPQQIYYVKSVTDANNFLITTTPPPNSATGATVTVTNLTGTYGRSIPTLNVGSTTGMPIVDNGVNPLGSCCIPLSNNQGALATLVYDSTLQVWMKQGGSKDVPGYLNNGAPYRGMLEIAKAVGAYPWFVMPRYTQISGTDFISSLATEIKNNWPSWMVPRFEGTNEDWGGNLQTQYGSAMGNAFAISTGNVNWLSNINAWHGRAISQICQAVYGVYGGATPATQTRYKCINGMQLGTETGSLGPNHSGFDQRYQSGLYVSTQGGSASYNWVTDVSPSGYFFPSTYTRNQEIVSAYNYYFVNGGTSKPTNGTLQGIADAYENTDIDGVQIATQGASPAGWVTGSPSGTINTTTAHNFFVGQIIQLLIQGGVAPIVNGNYYVQTIPTATSLTLSSTDPNMPTNFGVSGACACFTPVAVDAVANPPTGTAWLIPNAGANARFTIINNQNSKALAQVNNANVNVTQYEGGYSPDYLINDILVFITDATAVASSTFTAPLVNTQNQRSPQFQPTINNSPFVGGTAPAGMDLLISGCSGLGNGWAITDNTVVHITGTVTGSTFTTNLNKSGATGTLAAALAAHVPPINACSARLQDTNGKGAQVWVNTLRYAGKFSNNLQANLTTMYNGVGPFPSMYYLGGNTNTAFPVGGNITPAIATTFPSQSVWAPLEDIYQTPIPPQIAAATAFNH